MGLRSTDSRNNVQIALPASRKLDFAVEEEVEHSRKAVFGWRAPFATVLILPCASVNQVTIRLVSVSLIYEGEWRRSCPRGRLKFLRRSIIAILVLIPSNGPGRTGHGLLEKSLLTPRRSLRTLPTSVALMVFLSSRQDSPSQVNTQARFRFLPIYIPDPWRS